jgi:DNA polymerase (family 10)
MNAKFIANILDEIALTLELKGANPFQIRSFQNAARTLETLSQPLESFISSLVEKKAKGFGPELSKTVIEIYETGGSEVLKELKASFPETLFDLFRISGLGPKKIKRLYDELNISSLDQLSNACEKGEIAELKGFGAKSQDKMIENIKQVRYYLRFLRLDLAIIEADLIISKLNDSGLFSNLEISGQLKRHCEIIETLVFVGSATNKKKAFETFTSLTNCKEVIEQTETFVKIKLKSGPKAILYILPTSHFYAGLVLLTGSPAFAKNLEKIAKDNDYSLNSSLLFQNEATDNHLLGLSSENEIFNKLKLHPIPSELQENPEIIVKADLGSNEESPFLNLLEQKDVKGVLHVHSTYSDGVDSLKTLALAAKDLGYQYLGITDHSQSAAYANGMLPDRIKKQHDEIDLLNEKLFPFVIFKGIESDILVNGELDYNDKILSTFDFVIASVHSRFSLSEQEMTDRIINAIKNPFTTILGHPTGRLLLEREPYKVDMESVINAAANSRVAIEINADPHRLDLDWRLLQKAKSLGITIPICPDAHSVKGLANIKYGVFMARKGMLNKSDILNCKTAEELKSYFQSNK